MKLTKEMLTEMVKEVIQEQQSARGKPPLTNKAKPIANISNKSNIGLAVIWDPYNNIYLQGKVGKTLVGLTPLHNVDEFVSSLRQVADVLEKWSNEEQEENI